MPSQQCIRMMPSFYSLQYVHFQSIFNLMQHLAMHFQDPQILFCYAVYVASIDRILEQVYA